MTSANDFQYTLGLSEALLGLFAYDTGSTSTGIQDYKLKLAVAEYFHGITSAQSHSIMKQILDEEFLSDEARAKGYSEEDAEALLEWMREDLL